MRPVLVMKNGDYVPGVGYMKANDFVGKFHAWGLELFELFEQDNPVSYSVAIVEKDDGTVVTVSPSMVVFIAITAEEAHVVIDQRTMTKS